MGEEAWLECFFQLLDWRLVLSIVFQLIGKELLLIFSYT